ncbi:MAG TPA: ASCH domain-containing protein [Burkholderiales bacterium]
MNDAVTAFWNRYLDALPAGHPHRRAAPDVFSFGDSAAIADELAALVVQGRKRATTSLPSEYSSEGLPLPVAGDVSIVTRSDTEPVAIIEFVDVRLVPFQAVDAAYAAVEGEGDGSLAGWQAAHRSFFRRVCSRLGGRFEEATPVLCQQFRVVWPRKPGVGACSG